MLVSILIENSYWCDNFSLGSFFFRFSKVFDQPSCKKLIPKYSNRIINHSLSFFSQINSLCVHKFHCLKKLNLCPKCFHNMHLLFHHSQSFIFFSLHIFQYVLFEKKKVLFLVINFLDHFFLRYHFFLFWLVRNSTELG